MWGEDCDAIWGCDQEDADNYDEEVTRHDGSCYTDRSTDIYRCTEGAYTSETACVNQGEWRDNGDDPGTCINLTSGQAIADGRDASEELCIAAAATWALVTSSTVTIITSTAAYSEITQAQWEAATTDDRDLFTDRFIDGLVSLMADVSLSRNQVTVDGFSFGSLIVAYTITVSVRLDATS
eukprot:SAG11_NODE_585_length_8349_cov_38.121939_11_plen_181_part_00